MRRGRLTGAVRRHVAGFGGPKHDLDS
jgi:hypothetical protein